jgi:Domain of unknown function (DUF4157)
VSRSLRRLTRTQAARAELGTVAPPAHSAQPLDNQAMRQLVAHAPAGKPLAAPVRSPLEGALGADLSQVRLHDDPAARAASQQLQATAFTQGEDIYLGAQAPAVTSPAGQHLLAHEVAHVLQQRQRVARPGTLNTPGDAHEQAAEQAASAVRHGQPARVATPGAPPALQRQSVPGGGATPGTGQGIDLIFIIRAEDDQFTADVTKYVKTVLKGQTYHEVDNLDEIFALLAQAPAAAAGTAGSATQPPPKVRRIRIVAHGSTTGDVKMTPKGESKRRWFTPDEVKKFAGQKSVKTTVKSVMELGAQVEFWGCNIGNVAAAGEAWRDLFGAQFAATTETFKTGFDEYYRPAGKGEKGQTFKGNKGRWMQVTQSSEVDQRSKGLQKHFRGWLLQRYQALVDNGDIAPITGVDAQLAYMRDLFDRSNGEIKHIQVERKSNKKLVRPGDQQSWVQLWQTFTINP